VTGDRQMACESAQPQWLDRPARQFFPLRLTGFF
jgi:hypothetical protein